MVTPPPVLKLRGIGVEEGSSAPSVSKSGAVEVVIPLPGVKIGVERGRLLLRCQNQGEWRWRGGYPSSLALKLKEERSSPPPSSKSGATEVDLFLDTERTQYGYVCVLGVCKGVSKPFKQNGDVFLFIIS